MNVKNIFCFLLVLALFSCSNTTDKKSNNEKTAVKSISDIPVESSTKNFDELILVNSENQKLSFSDLKNKIVLVNFWASWVVTIPEEIKNIRKLQKDFKNTNLKIISVCFDEVYSDEFKKFVSLNNIDFELYFYSDNKNILKYFSEPKTKIPCSYLFDKNNNQIQIIKGNFDYLSLKKKIEGLLND